MSDTHRRYDAIKRALRQVMPVAPNSHREKHLNTLTALICGIVGSRHSQLPKVADQAPSSGAKRESRIQRYERWVAHDAVSYETFFLPFTEVLLAALAAQPLVLIMDGSTVGQGCVALMLNVVYGSRALPLAWVVVRGKKGHFPQDTHCALLKQVQPLIPDGASVIFLGDGEFDGTTLLATIHGYGWHYVCRTAATTLFWWGDLAFQIGDLTLAVDQAIAVPNTYVTAQSYGPLQVLAVWEVGYDAPIYLLTNLTEPEAAFDCYRKRSRVETFFSDQKSRGFHIHKSHLTDPTRLTRLLIAACLAYLWIVYLGVQAVTDKMLAVLHRLHRCDLSLFQLGLCYLSHCLNEDRALPVAFVLSLDGLTLIHNSNTFSVR